jgi:hypothetical protein
MPTTWLLLAAVLQHLPGTPSRLPIERFQWGALNIVVAPDSSEGLLLWASTSAAVERRGGAPAATFIGRFAPDSLAMWLVQAQALLEHKAPLPTDTETALPTPALHSLWGGELLFARRREHNTWSSATFWYLAIPVLPRPLMFAIPPRDTRALLAALERGASRSRLTVSEEISEQPAPDSATCPQWVSPYQLAQNVPFGSEVWGSVVVDTTGRAQMKKSYQLLFADNANFAIAVQASVAATHFPPKRAPIRYYFRFRF